MTLRTRVAALAASLLLAVAGTTVAQGPEYFQGNLIDMPQAVARRSSAMFILQIDRWGSQEEATAYLQILKDKGQKGLIDAFWKSKAVGFIRVGDRLGYPIIFARSIPAEDGRIIRAFTDRPLQFFEPRNNLRSTDYPLGIIEIKFVDGKKKGEGIADRHRLGQVRREGESRDRAHELGAVQADQHDGQAGQGKEVAPTGSATDGAPAVAGTPRALTSSAGTS